MTTPPPPGQHPDPTPDPQGQYPPPQGQYPPPGHFPPPQGQFPPGQYPPPQGQFPPGQFPPPQGQFPPGQYPQQGPPFPPPPSNGSRRTSVIIGAVAVVVAIVAFVGYRALGTHGPSDAQTAAAAATTGAVSSVNAPTSANAGGDVSVDVAVGECIKLSGTLTDANADPKTCGSAEANYKVIGKAPTEEQCVTDYDQVYFEQTRIGGKQEGALCLDLDWVVGDCFDLDGNAQDDDPVRVACSAATTDDVKVEKILQHSVDKASCTDRSYTYDTQQIVVCVTDPTQS